LSHLRLLIISLNKMSQGDATAAAARPVFIGV